MPDCNPSKAEKERELWITIEKQILRDLASGILAEVINLSDLTTKTQEERQSLRQISQYVMKLVALLGEGEVT